MTVWNPIIPSVQVKIHRPRLACTKFLRQHPNPFSKSKVRNPKSIPKGWMFVCGFGIGLLILEGPGKSPLGNLGTMRCVDGPGLDLRFKTGWGECGCGWRWWSASSIFFYTVLCPAACRAFFHCEIQPKTLSQDKLESLPKKGPAEHSCCTTSNVLSHLVILASWQLRSSRFPKHPLAVREDQALQAPRFPRQKLQLQRSWRGRQRP